MNAFRYEAARADGRTVRGVLEASTRGAATATLSERGLYPVLVEPAPARRTRTGWHRPSVVDTATVVRSLATFVNAGIPLARALQTTESIASGILRDALVRVGARVREGAALGAALADEAALFSGVTVGLVRAGERGMGLGPALLEAAAQGEREAETRAQLRAALAYPLLLAVVGSLSVGMIVLFVIPRFAAILGDLGQALPPATRALIALSSWTRRLGLVFLALAVPGAALAAEMLRRHRRRWHEALLGTPVVGPLRHALATARVARALGALLETGTHALTALAIAADAAGDQAVAARLAEARERVAEGVGLTTSLRDARALTDAALQLAAVGEGSGRLPELLRRAAEFEELQAERRLRVLVGLLEPALIIAFAAIVAFVAAALLQAIYAVRPG